MAGNLSVKSSESAEAWIAKATELSDKAHEAMKETAKICQEIKHESAGTLADEMVEWGNVVFKQADKVTKVAAEVTGVIKNVMNHIGKFVETVGGFITGATKILG